jgi:isoquinoline 1-oxidoreductase beta subunit
VKRGTDPVAYRLELIKDPRARRVVKTLAGMADWGRKRDGHGMGFAFLDYSDSLVAGISLERSTGKDHRGSR